MKIVLDENIDRAIIERLRSLGHEVCAVVEECCGVSDEKASIVSEALAVHGAEMSGAITSITSRAVRIRRF